MNPVLDASAKKLDLKWTHGDPLSMMFAVKDGHLNGWTVPCTAQVRAAKSTSSTLYATLTIVTAQYNSGVHGTAWSPALDADDTVVTISLSAANNAAIPMPANGGDRIAWWDLQRTGGATPLSGKVTIEGQVTA